MDGGRAGLQTYPIGAAPLENFRLFQLHFLRCGHHHPIAGGLDGGESRGNFIVLPPDFRQLGQQVYQCSIILDGDACPAAENLIKQCLWQNDGAADHAAAEIHAAQTVVLNQIQSCQGSQCLLGLPQVADFSRSLEEALVQRCFHRVFRFQSIQPPGQEHPQLRHGEGGQHRLEKSGDAGFVQALTIGNIWPESVLLCNIPLHRFCQFAPRLPAVHHHQKGLARGLHVQNGSTLCRNITGAGNVRNAAVGGEHQADGAVLLHHLFGAQLCRLGHGNFPVIPGGCHHAGNAVFFRPHRTVYHVAHAVNHPHPQAGCTVRGDFHRLLRHKLRLGGHNGFAGTALGQLIPGALPAIWLLNGGNHQFLHDSLDQGGFSGSHRPNYTNIDIAAGSCGNFRIDFLHQEPPVRQE